MKTFKLNYLVLAFLVSLSFGLGDAHAGLFDKVNLKGILDGAKTVLDEAGKKLNEAHEAQKMAQKRAQERELERQHEIQKIQQTPAQPADVAPEIATKSYFDISGKTVPGIKMLQIDVAKGDFKAQYYVPVVTDTYKARIFLHAGQGLYNINIFASTEDVIPDFTKGEAATFVKSVSVNNTDMRDVRFLLPSQKVQSNDPKIIALTKELTQNSRNNEEAITAIHDYISSNIKYDFAAVKDGSFNRKNYDAVYTLNNPLVVCEGYANLLAAMARAYGIKAKVVEGMALVEGRQELHAWNEVFVNGEWKIIDSTWNSILGTNKYFFIDETLFSEDHTKTQEIAR